MSSLATEEATVYETAQQFKQLGISFMPVRGAEKKPDGQRLEGGSWKYLQSQLPTDEEVTTWFGDNHDPTVGIAAITGRVSGWLVIRDFDNEISYDAWRAAHPDVAARCPTEKSPHGHHVYVRVPGVEVRTRKIGTKDDNDGEIRGEGAYTVCAPSVGEGGELYEWLIPLDVGIPVVDLEASGLASRWDGRKAAPSQPLLARLTQEVYRGESCVTSSCVTPSAPSCVSRRDTGAPVVDDEAIIAVGLRWTIPISEGTRHGKIFEFIRILRASPNLAKQSASQLEPVFRRWFELALPHISTQDWKISWDDFRSGWTRAYSAASDDPRVAIEIARSLPLPPCAARYDGKEKKELLGLLSVMQAFHGDKSFFLSCRTAGVLTGVSHVTAARYLQDFHEDGLLVPTHKYAITARTKSGKRMAYEYRYVGDQVATVRPGIEQPTEAETATAQAA